MSISTYQELKDAVGGWLNDDQLDAQAGDFIALAEAHFNRVIRHPDMVTKNDSFSVDGQYVAKPTGFLGAKRLTLLTTPVRLVEFVSQEEMSEYRQGVTGSGKPRYYSLVGSNFEFLPSPDSTYTASLVYYKEITALSDDNTSNWLLTSHPDIYLFGALCEAEPYVRNDERFPLWQSRLEKALRELEIQSERERFGQTPRVRFKAFE